ncbi:MAG: tRNA lysidine(34) synthetase TilS [Verrucomicrobiota bacterium]
MKTDWLRWTAALAARLPRDTLHPTVLAWAEGRTRAARGGWAVAFSGGADSLALLLMLWAHFPARRAGLVALHFNHRLRGRAADADEAFCRRVAGALGVTFRRAGWRRLGKNRGEAAARTARFAFLEREQKRAGASALWLGHQQDDIAETMFMRLARGSGTAGLAAPRPVQPMPGGRVHLRPLLTLKKTELTAALRAVGAPWREDATNAGDDFFRNRVRRAVLPAWRRAAAGRDALAGAALARERLEEDDTALEAWMAQLGVLDRGGRRLNLAALAGVPRAVVRRALHRWLLAQPDPGDLSRQGFDQLLVAVERGAATRFSLGWAGFAVLRRGQLVYERARREKQRRRKRTRI